MSARPCRDCGTTEDVRSYGLCQPCGFARGVAERAAQGLGPHCTHGPTLERIATLMGVGHDGPKSASAGTTAAARGRAPRRTTGGTTVSPATTKQNGRDSGARTDTAPAPTTAAS